ncbi:MAG: type II secretion system F family protein [Thermodesulfovibrionales bacterium]
METASILIACLVFAGIALAGLTLFSFSKAIREQRELVEKLREGRGSSYPEGKSFLSSDRYFVKLLLRGAGFLGKWTKPKDEQELSRMRKALLKGGYRRESAVFVFVGVKVFLLLICPLLFWVVKAAAGSAMPPSYAAFFLVASSAVGYYLPNLVLSSLTRARKRKLMESFPDALDLLVICVEAGMGLDAAINKVGEEMRIRSRVLSDEFRLLSLELRGGKLRKDALRNLALRTDLEEVNGLTTLLIQTDRFGTRVAQALRVHSDAMRTKRYMRAEEVAAKLPTKMIFPLVLCIFPSLFITILGPAFIQLHRIFLSR